MRWRASRTRNPVSKTAIAAAAFVRRFPKCFIPPILSQLPTCRLKVRFWHCLMGHVKEFDMRIALSIVIAVVGLGLTPFVDGSDANALVCARGVVRAGCVGAVGAVAVRRPPIAAACRTVIVNGVAVRRCV